MGAGAGWFLVGVMLLVVAGAVGYWRWRPRLAGKIDAVSGFVLIAATLGGLLGTPFWWLDLPDAFAWDLPPLASRMLAAAALAFGIAGVVVLERPVRARVRLQLALVAIYLIPLAVAVLALHLDRFDFRQPITYGFFATVVVLSVGALVALWSGRDAERATPPPALQRIWLTGAGVVLGAWGLALFVAPATDAMPLVFVWASDPLTSRLIAAMLLTIAFAFLASQRDTVIVAPALIFAATYGAGVVAAGLMNAAANRPVPLLYVLAFGLVALVSAFLLVPRTKRP